MSAGRMPFFPCIRPDEILLPAEGVDGRKWAVIACDQYTSQPDYWKRVRAEVGDAPSTLHMICPEAELSSGYDRDAIREAMDLALENQTVTARNKQGKTEKGFVLTERSTPSGVRIGLVASLDLETYDYRPGNQPVRATEATVEERLPPRIRIRENASLDLPHILLLMDDKEKTVLEPLTEAIWKDGRVPDYDLELMESGGHLRGWRITAEQDLNALSVSLNALAERSGGLLFAVGDGNHSLAAAKACWEKRKANGADPETDPFRYALAEIVNLHEDAIRFQPIHRLVTGIGAADLADAFRAACRDAGLSCEEGTEIRFVSDGRVTEGLTIENRGGVLPVQILQPFLDAYLRAHPNGCIDYIHGDQTLVDLTAGKNAAGILLEGMRKEELFPGIRAGGCLPRKTFSMGQADEKRFYFESRKLRG